MSERQVTVTVSERTLRRAKRVAHTLHCDVEDVLADWLGSYADNIPVEMLPDDDILRLCAMRVNQTQQYELRRLLSIDRERGLDAEESLRLDELLQSVRRSITRKARALQVAQARGLRVAR